MKFGSYTEYDSRKVGLAETPGSKFLEFFSHGHPVTPLVIARSDLGIEKPRLGDWFVIRIRN